PLGVGAQGAVVVQAARLSGGEVQQVREVLGQVAEVAFAEIDGAGRDAVALDPGARLRVAEAGDAPHLVIGGKGSGEGFGDLAGGSGDEDLLVRKHRGGPYCATPWT